MTQSTTVGPTALAPAPRPRRSGPLGRLGRWAAEHRRAVFAAWAVAAVALGVFAPRVEHALSGAGWQADGSQSVQARELVKREFGGLDATALMVVVHSDDNRTGSAPGCWASSRRGSSTPGGRCSASSSPPPR